MLHFLLYVVKRQLTICLKSSKPIQIGLCMLMSLSIHLHGLHLDTQYGHVSMRVCLSVCLSVTSRYCIETAEWIELVFGTHASIDLSYAVY